MSASLIIAFLAGLSACANAPTQTPVESARRDDIAEPVIPTTPTSDSLIDVIEHVLFDIRGTARRAGDASGDDTGSSCDSGLTVAATRAELQRLSDVLLRLRDSIVEERPSLARAVDESRNLISSELDRARDESSTSQADLESSMRVISEVDRFLTSALQELARAHPEGAEGIERIERIECLHARLLLATSVGGLLRSVVRERQQVETVGDESRRMWLAERTQALDEIRWLTRELRSYAADGAPDRPEGEDLAGEASSIPNAPRYFGAAERAEVERLATALEVATTGAARTVRARELAGALEDLARSALEGPQGDHESESELLAVLIQRIGELLEATRQGRVEIEAAFSAIGEESPMSGTELSDDIERVRGACP